VRECNPAAEKQHKKSISAGMQQRKRYASVSEKIACG
jgi:hypothetical protein